MTKEELREKRNLAIENLNYAIAILGSDELYIDELEKEIAELKEQNTNLQEMLKTERSVTCKEEYLKKVTELEQENAELKDDNKVMADNYSKMEQKFYDNLTKAKEHIENLLYYTKQCTCERSNYAEIEKDIKEAEQFIKDSEVEK